MPPLRNTTFISQTTGQTLQVKPRDPFTVLGVSFILISLFMSGIAYGAGWYFQSQGDILNDQVLSMESQFSDKERLKEVLAFHGKVTSIDRVLQQHTYATNIFNTISYKIDSLVYFKRFDLSYRDATGYQLALTGVARSYDAVVRQIDLFKEEITSSEDSSFTSLEIKTISADQLGNINFDLILGISPTVKNPRYSPQGTPTPIVSVPAINTPTVSTTTGQATSPLIEELLNPNAPRGNIIPVVPVETPEDNTNNTATSDGNNAGVSSSGFEVIPDNNQNVVPVINQPQSYE